MSRPQAEQQVVIFTVGKHYYGVPIGWVREVVVWSEPTPVPGAAGAVQGVINLRGQVIPVVDLGLRLDAKRQRQGADARVMVVEVGERPVGLVVDEVSEVTGLRADVVEAPSPVVQGQNGQRLVTGIAKLDGRMVMLVDVPQLVGDSAALDSVTAAPQAG